MPTQEPTPQKEVKPKTSNSSTPDPEEWFEDSLLNALRAHNRKLKQAAPAK